MWGTDLTSTLTGEGQASIFLTVDHCSTECLGIHPARQATRFDALEPIRQAARSCFGAFAQGIASGLKVRHDHGSHFVADDFQAELAFLGIESSPAFVREPEATAASSASFVRSRRTFCGSAASPLSRNSATPCWSSSGSTTRAGWSSGTAIAHARQVRADQLSMLAAAG
jgi:hypothetical protein